MDMSLSETICPYVKLFGSEYIFYRSQPHNNWMSYYCALSGLFFCWNKYFQIILMDSWTNSLNELIISYHISRLVKLRILELRENHLKTLPK